MAPPNDCMREVSQELQALLQGHGTASEGSDPAQRDAFAVIQGRNLATSLMVDTILEQWETVIQPLDVQGLVADDMEMGTKQPGVVVKDLIDGVCSEYFDVSSP